MLRIFFCLFLLIFSYSSDAFAGASDFMHYFKVNMNIPIPNIDAFSRKFLSQNKPYDRKYDFRSEIGINFNKEFSRTIKFYGLSENRIKNDYEDNLLEILSWLPKETYPYIGPMLHEVPGMSDKILNLPGIKETKNKFPENIDESLKNVENLEYLSPALYFLLMPRTLVNPQQQDRPQPARVRKPRPIVNLPSFLRIPNNILADAAEKEKGSTQKEVRPSVIKSLNLRTIHPTIGSPLTARDVEAFSATLDPIIEWGNKNNMENYSRIIYGGVLLDAWEQEQNTAIPQNNLKDIVNPCQRLVLKTKFAKKYEEFAQLVAEEAFTPEEWAYTCDKTIKALRIASTSMDLGFAVNLHKQGYYSHYFEKLPAKWKNNMYTSEAAIIKMYTALYEDIETVRPYIKELDSKFSKTEGVLLTVPIFY